MAQCKRPLYEGKGREDTYIQPVYEHLFSGPKFVSLDGGVSWIEVPQVNLLRLLKGNDHIREYCDIFVRRLCSSGYRGQLLFISCKTFLSFLSLFGLRFYRISLRNVLGRGRSLESSRSHSLLLALETCTSRQMKLQESCLKKSSAFAWKTLCPPLKIFDLCWTIKKAH